MKRVKLGSYALGVMSLLLAGTAAAQMQPPEQQPQPQPQPAPAPAPAPAPQPQAQPVQAQGEVGMALPGAAPAQQAGAVAGESDHDTMIGRLAVGYLGRRSMLIAGRGIDPTGQTFNQDPIDAPVIGIRYWVDQLIGIDAGVGFLITAGSTETTVTGAQTITVDDAGITAFILHAGVPLSLGSEGHFSFQLVPEANVGFASRSESIPNPPAVGGSVDTDMSGFHLDVGLRAGAEIHFGFIDIPQLSLQGSIGVRYALDNTSITVTTPPTPGENTQDRSQSAFGTTVGDNPWNIFTSNVAALYYF